MKGKGKCLRVSLGLYGCVRRRRWLNHCDVGDGGGYVMLVRGENSVRLTENGTK